MARKNNKKEPLLKNPLSAVPTETKKGVFAIVLFIVGLFLVLAAFGIAGTAGSDAYRLFNYLLGIGYFLLPLLFFVLAGNALRSEIAAFTPLKIISSIVFIAAGLGFFTIVGNGGGIVGSSIAEPLINMFDVYATVIILGGLALISLLLLLEGGMPTATLSEIGRLLKKPFSKKIDTELHEPIITGGPEEGEGVQDDVEVTRPANAIQRAAPQPEKASKKESNAASLALLLGKYTPPPVSLLEKDRGRPGVGDIKANANLIKRTLQNFGIVVELDEISIGPSVTRYAIKPAEGVRLQKILSLQNNLELALAAHPVRIEAPIPGKSLVGIEVPNSAKVTVGLGTLLDTKEFTESPKPLLVAMGRDIAGGSQFGNITKMPHLLIAGATGSGKSVAIHGLINSLIYRMGPAQLRFIMIDPKRVELTLYRSLPHLLTPVITDAKKAIAALRWAGKEMDRRYNILEEHRVRDIGSYHENILAPTLENLRKGGGPGEGEEVPEGMPYIVIILDELADIMQSFPRELEGAVVRLAQMSRAVGIHLVLSTQRPSVNVITGLIKANVPSRVALQVASQFDSRTILDQGGAENLLGSGDMLYMSAEMGKPIRLQNAYISEKEVKAVVDFIAQNNEAELPIEIGGTPSDSGGGSSSGSSSGGFSGDEGEVDDNMYEAAKTAVQEAGKASTSYIQRKLRVGYARAARLMDMLEERGVIGPSDGAKPRDVLEKPAGDGGGNQGEV